VHADAEATFAAVEKELEERISALLGELASFTPMLANAADAPLDAVVLLDLESDAGDRTQALADGRVARRVAIPALGLGPVEALPIDDRVVVSDSSMANRHLAVRWDGVGNLTSIIDIAHAREIVPTGSFFAFLELAPDHPVEYDAWDLESWTRNNSRALTAAVPHRDTVEVVVEDGGPLVGRVRVKRTFGPSSSVVTYELRAESQQLLVHVELDWHHDEHLLSMAFPLDVRSTSASCDVQFGVVERPTHPSSPWDAAKFEVCAHRYVDFSEPDFGVAVLNTGRYGYALFGGAIRVSLARAAKYPDPDADRGRHEVTFAVLPHGPGLTSVRAAASLLNAPIRLVRPTTKMSDDSESTRRETPLIAVTGPSGAHEVGIEIDAVKLADDGSGDLIVRLHEGCGNRVRISVRSQHHVGAAWRCNLLEEPETGEEVGDGIVTLTLRPFQLVTLRMRLLEGSDGRTLDD
jgi:alpha-mannosidase